jgi:hypothetical protein
MSKVLSGSADKDFTVLYTQRSCIVLSDRIAIGMKLTGKSLLALAWVSALTVACADSSFKGTSKTIPPKVTKEFTQENLPVADQSYVQGFKGDISSENFDQGDWGKLDLLVVVDNSGSMKEEQANLGTKLNPLLSKVEKSDWQIAVATTDPDDGCRIDLIKKSDTNPSQKFAAAVQRGTNGSGVERGILQAVRGLQNPCLLSQDWVRADSTLAVLIISDEDNCHIDTAQGYGCTGEDDLSYTHLTNYMSSIRTLGTDARIYGIIWHPSTAQAQCTTALKTGDAYAQAIEASGGKWGSICDADYTNTLTAISEDVAKILDYEFELAETPIDGSLKVLVDGSIFDQFTLEDKLVKFTEAPPFGSKVEFAYRHGNEGEIKADFDIKDAHSAPLEVTVDGTAVAESNYTWDDQAKKLVFIEEPSDKSEIKIKYKKEAKLKSEFDIGKGVKKGTLTVTVDGKETPYTYEETTGTIAFNPPPPEAAKIKATYVKQL